jgi:hypothetical protein
MRRGSIVFFGLGVGAALAGVSAAGTAQQQAPLGSSQRGCDTRLWPVTAEGTPAALSSGSGYFVWHDLRGWHIRTRGAAGDRFQASVVADVAVRVSTASATLRNGLRLNGRSFSFGFAGGARLVGLNFRAPCAGRLSFRFGPERPPASRAPSAPQQPVYLGSKGYAPGATFVLGHRGVGGVAGRILVGPTCPDVAPGVDCPPAKPAAGTIRIETAASARGGGGGQLVKTIVSDAEGHFATDLPPGEYLLVVVKADDDLTPPTPKPSLVTVEAGVVTRVTLLLDTGIR